MLCTAIIASIAVMLVSQASEYDPYKLEVVTTSLRWESLILVTILIGITVKLASGLNMRCFHESVQDFARIQAQGGNFIVQDPQCVKDLNQCITAINDLQKFYHQPVILLPQFGLDGQLDLDGQSVDQAAKGPSDHVTDGRNQHLQTLVSLSALSSPLLEAYKIISENPQCISALKQWKHDIDQPNRKKQTDKGQGNFLECLDKLVKDYSKIKNFQWAIIPFIVLPTICHLPYVGKQVFMFGYQGDVRDKLVTSGEKYFRNEYPLIRTIVECILTRYPLSFIAAFALCACILYDLTTDKESIIAVISCIILLFVIGSTFHGTLKSATANFDPQDIELGYSGDSIAETSWSNTYPQVPREDSHAVTHPYEPAFE